MTKELQELVQVPALKYAHLAPEIWSKLGEIKRTGWLQHGIQNPETVQEHTIALLNLAGRLSDQLSPEELNGLTDMLEVHDWVEAYTGDIVALNDDTSSYKELKERKNKLEQEAIIKIKEQLGERGQEIFDLWHRFEHSDDPSAKFARELDKYQAIEKALEYEQVQGVKVFKEFYDYSIEYISHPVLLKCMKGMHDTQRERGLHRK